MTILYKNINYKFETTILNEIGKCVSGLTIDYEIRKCSDDSLLSFGEMIEVNSVYTVSYTFTDLGQYRIKYITPSGYEHGFENVIVEDYDNFKADISGQLIN